MIIKEYHGPLNLDLDDPAAGTAAAGDPRAGPAGLHSDFDHKTKRELGHVLPPGSRAALGLLLPDRRFFTINFDEHLSFVAVPGVFGAEAIDGVGVLEHGESHSGPATTVVVDGKAKDGSRHRHEIPLETLLEKMKHLEHPNWLRLPDFIFGKDFKTFLNNFEGWGTGPARHPNIPQGVLDFQAKMALSIVHKVKGRVAEPDSGALLHFLLGSKMSTKGAEIVTRALFGSVTLNHLHKYFDFTVRKVVLALFRSPAVEQRAVCVHVPVIIKAGIAIMVASNEDRDIALGVFDAALNFFAAMSDEEVTAKLEEIFHLRRCYQCMHGSFTHCEFRLTKETACAGSYSCSCFGSRAGAATAARLGTEERLQEMFACRSRICK